MLAPSSLERVIWLVGALSRDRIRHITEDQADDMIGHTGPYRHGCILSAPRLPQQCRLVGLLLVVGLVLA
jgi:hypothetical protein